MSWKLLKITSEVRCMEKDWFITFWDLSMVLFLNSHFVSKIRFSENFTRAQATFFWLTVVRLSNQAWIEKGGNWTGLFFVRRKKEPFPDVNVICAFLLMKSIFSCCKWLLEVRKQVFFLLLIPPSRKTRFKLTWKNRIICHTIGLLLPHNSPWNAA